MIPVIAYGFICIWWGWANGVTIKKENSILHWANMIIHASTCIYFAIYEHWSLGLAMFFEARLFFEIAINLTRKKGIGYVTPTPTAVTDIIEQAIFGKNGILPKIVYLILFVSLLLIYKNFYYGSS